MSIESVKDYLRSWNRDTDILEFASSTATVDAAAQALGVIPARIAKTLSFRGTGPIGILVVAAGDARIDNQLFRTGFGLKAKMLSPEEVLEQTGHAVGGVCPFGLAQPLPVYLDVSLKRFDTVFPACGSSHSAIELTLDELEEYARAIEWVDVCKDWR